MGTCFRWAILMTALAAPAAADDGALAPHFLYNGAVITDAAGGTRTGTVGVGTAHLQLAIDAGTLADGLTVFVDGLAIHGGAPDALIGDAQGVSNIAAPPALRLYEGWVQLTTGRVSLLAGRYDVNSEFYRLSSASLFLNSSFGIGPEYANSGVAGPSIFPDTSLALRFAYKPRDDVVLRLAVIDDVPPDQPGRDGALVIGEAAWLGRDSKAMAPGESHSRTGRNSGLPPYDDKIALGVWYDTKGSADLLHPGVSHHASGAYVIADHRLLKSGDATLAGFVQAGLADGRVGRFGTYLGLGLTAQGFVPGRSDDEFGLALAWARNGAHYNVLQKTPGFDDADPRAPTAAETTIELTYLAQIAGWLALQPDMQLVLNPNTRSGHALVFQLEAEVSL